MSFWIDVPEEENGNITYNEVVALMNAHESAVTEEIEDFETETRANLQTLSTDLNAEANARNSHDTQLQNAIDNNTEDIDDLKTNAENVDNVLTTYGTRLTTLESYGVPCKGGINVWGPFMTGDTPVASTKVYIPSGYNPLSWQGVGTYDSTLYTYNSSRGTITFNKNGYVLVSGQFYIGMDEASTTFLDYCKMSFKMSKSTDGTNWADVGGVTGTTYVGDASSRDYVAFSPRVINVTAGMELMVQATTENVSHEPFIGNDWDYGASRFEAVYLSYNN